MAYLKLIMALIWGMILALSTAIFLINIFDEGNILVIRIAFISIFLSVPTLIAIIKEVKD